MHVEMFAGVVQHLRQEGGRYFSQELGGKMTKKLLFLIMVAAMSVALSSATTQAAKTVWKVDGRNITLNGERFIVKGVNYSPAPIGSDTAWIPFGDYFIPEWKTIYQRDLPVLRKMGANSVRLYFMYPYVKNENYSNGKVADHSGFFKAAYNNGNDPVYVFVAYPLNVPFTDTQKKEYLTLAAQLANDPAVMGFLLSNELNSDVTRDSMDFWLWLDVLGKEIKKIAPDKLTMVSIVDDGLISLKKAEALGQGMPNIDVWGINSYRGNATTGFDVLFKDFKNISPKPMLVTEFGCPASMRDSQGHIVDLPDNAKAQADYLKVHWQDIVKNEDICSGGHVFIWTDEWWKSGNPPKHDPTNTTNVSFPGGWDDEEWFGINAVKANNRPNNDPWNPGHPNAPDLLLPRAAFGTLMDLWK